MPRPGWKILLEKVQESELLEWLKKTTGYLGQFDVAGIREHITDYSCALQVNDEESYTVILIPGNSDKLSLNV